MSIKFLRRKSDKKLYRGAKFWRWCKNWRHAAAVDDVFWQAFILPKMKEECELVTLDDILKP